MVRLRTRPGHTDRHHRPRFRQASEAAADATKAKAEDASETAKATIKEDAAANKAQAEAASDALKGDEPAAEAVANNPAAAEADCRIQKALDYIKENKLDLAETTIKKLEDNKASLPTAVQGRDRQHAPRCWTPPRKARGLCPLLRLLRNSG